MKAGEARIRPITPTGTHLIVPCLLFAIILFVQFASAQEQDKDRDGIPDSWEEDNGLNPDYYYDANQDDDKDGLKNINEFKNNTDPQDPDTDNDTMPDGWEVRYGLDPLNASDADLDKDRDGLSNKQEYLGGWDPTNPRSPPEVPEPPTDDDDGPRMEGEDKAAASICIIYLFFMAGGAIVVFVVIAFYTKLKKEKLLEHETRQRIIDHIRQNPGTYYTEIQKNLGLAHGVLTHHLNMLETQELIFSKQDRQFRRFYVEGMHSNGPMVTGSQKLILEAIRKNPGLSQSDVARMLSVSRMVVSYHVSGLEKLGLVEGHKEGRESLLYPIALDDTSDTGRPLYPPLYHEGERISAIPDAPSRP
ncbi:MAG: winged helix-turn-helix transcriptional regulator [Candidatus Thermoplasmatota archaeon]|jgi:predicted transcriptional regulator|nr:winged helix-turn-helix transcriptional regulator [Candidatus Thermoplasmatota archaeon]